MKMTPCSLCCTTLLSIRHQVAGSRQAPTVNHGVIAEEGVHSVAGEAGDEVGGGQRALQVRLRNKQESGVGAVDTCPQ